MQLYKADLHAKMHEISQQANVLMWSASFYKQNSRSRVLLPRGWVQVYELEFAANKNGNTQEWRAQVIKQAILTFGYKFEITAIKGQSFWLKPTELSDAV